MVERKEARHEKKRAIHEEAERKVRERARARETA